MRTISALLALTVCLVAASYATEPNSSSPGPQVSPTSGESWLHHLHRPFDVTSMCKTGRLGPPSDPDGVAVSGWRLGMLPETPNAVTLHGADLYRLNCQGCHGEKGEGAPPEINSVVNPVRATSVQLVIERMKKAGMDISPSAAAQLARQSQDALMQRLHQGGESMPAFQQLSDTEIRALISYLKQLAGVPGASQSSVSESPLRVGELIVKSTCHTCHDANGLNPTPQELENGAIPPLETLTTRTDQLQLIRKVTSGAPIVMGNPPTPHRGRMPVFYYLTREEAADVYLYLATVPPTTVLAAVAPAPAVPHGGGPGAGLPSHPTPSGKPAVPRLASSVRSTTTSDGIPDWMVTLALLLVGGAVAGLLVAALCFAGYELNRLSRNSEALQNISDVPVSLQEESEDFAVSSHGGNFDARVR